MSIHWGKHWGFCPVVSGKEDILQDLSQTEMLVEEVIKPTKEVNTNKLQRVKRVPQEFWRKLSMKQLTTVQSLTKNCLSMWGIKDGKCDTAKKKKKISTNW